MTKIIFLTKRKYALVDDEDYEYLSQWKWYASKQRNTWYAKRKDGTKSIFMHRLIMGTPNNKLTDHINKDGLDNRKENLRICTNSDNQHNIPTHRNNNKTGYKGVSSYRGKYQAQIKYKNKTYWLGMFDTPEDAHTAYVNKAKELHGDFFSL